MISLYKIFLHIFKHYKGVLRGVIMGKFSALSVFTFVIT